MNRADPAVAGRGQRAEGFVSIFSVLIIMAILTLVAVGFSNITRSAQKRTLDNQLNTQAFYAAESGVNDAKKILAANPAYTKSDCQLPVAGFTYTIDATLDIGYTCVLVRAPTDLQFDTVSTEGGSAPKTGTIESTTADPIGAFDISWDGPGGAHVPIHDPAGTYPNILDPSAVWGDHLGMLRVDLTPIDGSLDRATLATESYGIYLYPSQNSPTAHGAVKGTEHQAGLIYVNCADNVSPCKATVPLGLSTSRKYFVRVQSIYNPVSSVVIDNFKNNSGTNITTKSGQVVIDVTGRAKDVLRRIQVRVKQAGTENFSSDFSIQSGGTICKRLMVGNPTGATAADRDTTTDQTDPSCLTN